MGRVIQNARELIRNPVLRTAFMQFDPQDYLDINPDVAASGIDPLEHMLRFGLNEDRSLTRRASSVVSLSRGNAAVCPPVAARRVLIVSCLAQPEALLLGLIHELIEAFRHLDYGAEVLVEGQDQLIAWRDLVGDPADHKSPGAATNLMDIKDLGLAAWLQSNWASISCIIAADEPGAERARFLAPTFPNIGAIVQLHSSAQLPSVDMPLGVLIHEWVNGTWSTHSERIESAVLGFEGLATRILALGRGLPNDGSHRAIAARLPLPVQNRRDVVALPIIDWNYRRARPQHFSSALASRGCRVFYMGVRSYLASKTVVRLQDSPEPNVFQCSFLLPGEPLAVHHRNPTEEQLSHMALGLTAFMKEHGIVDPVYLIQHPFWAPLMSRLPAGLIAYDIADRLDALQETKWHFDISHWGLVESADWLTVSADLIREDVAGKSSNIEVVRNATTSEFLEEPRRHSSGGGRPQVGYVGSLTFWFDAPLLRDVALKRPGYDFLIYGAPEEPAASILSTAVNIQLLGEVSHHEVPHRLVELDAGVIPFRRSPLIDATNPVKAYEYLASGLPIVATPMPEMTRFPASDVWVAETSETFAQCLDQAVTSSTISDVLRRRCWASDQTWENRIAQVPWLWEWNEVSQLPLGG